MPQSGLTPLLLFAIVATVSPGGATALVTASGANFGFWRSLPLIAGLATGLASMAAVAAAGLAALLLSEPALQLAMKTAGSGYLLWLAWRIAHGSRPDLGRRVATPTSFLGGIGLLWVNPKGWAMTLSAAGSFVGLAEEPGRLALLLGATFGLASAASLTAWCAVGLVVARTLRTETHWRAMNASLGLLLVASVIPIWL